MLGIFHIRGIRGWGALVLGEGIIHFMFLACIGLAFHMLKTCSIIAPLKYIEYGVCGYYYTVHNAVFYLLKGDYISISSGSSSKTSL